MVAFVDGDDVLSPDYVTRLLEETLLNTLVETVVFRMSVGTQALPPKEDVMFAKHRVGISFAITRHLF